MVGRILSWIWNKVIKSTISKNVLSGIILTSIFFWTREKIFPLPDIAGHWAVEMHTDTSDIDKYQEMKVKYEAILWREGAVVRGTIEKTSEKTQHSDSTRTYTGKNRTHGDVEGFIQKLYFSSKDRVTIHILEKGEQRNFTHFHDLTTVIGTDSIAGKFFATAANSKGTSTWVRIADDEQ